MKLLTETFTQLTKTLLDLNQETRQKLLSMPSSTEQGMKKLEAWLVEIERKVEDCENVFSVVTHHLKLLKVALKEQQQKVSSKD